MDSNTWGWAFGQIVSTIGSVFGFAITAFGAATVTILFFIWFTAVIRLVIRPIIGMKMYGSFAEVDRNSRRVAHEKAEARRYGVKE